LVPGRTRRLRGLIGLFIILLSFAGPAAQARTTETQRLNETRRQLRAARSRLAQVRRTDGEMLVTIATVTRQLGSAQRQLQAARATLAAINSRIVAAQRRIERLQLQRTARLAIIGARVRALYIAGPGLEAEALLSSTSVGDFIERSTALDFVVRNDKAFAQDVARLEDRTRKMKAALARQLAEAASWRERVSERVSLVSEALDTHRLAEAAVAKRVRAYLDEVRALEAEQNRILNIIRSRTSFGTGRISGRGFAWPVAGRHITSPYGRRWGGFHTGIDIDCNYGDPIWAAKGGKVVAAEWGGGYGRMIIIDHGNGVATLYAHQSRLYAREGQRVEQLQKVGACGETGNATGTHLHFEVRINGNPVNPRPYLP
jgi:murein DD-endopeptidase MepM/ murein hydrolase activator NlpD